MREYNVIERVLLRIKIEWLYLEFIVKYPESTTEPVKGLSKYCEYLRNVSNIRDRLNELKHVQKKKYRIKNQKNYYIVQQRIYLFFWKTVKHKSLYHQGIRKFYTIIKARSCVNDLKALNLTRKTKAKYIEYM